MMNDLMARQVQHRIDEYYRMMTRVNGIANAQVPRASPRRVRVAVAHILIALATRLAPPRAGERAAS